MSTQNEADQQPDSATAHGTADPLQILDADGTVLSNATVPDLSDGDLIAMYEDIKLARRFDQRAISLQRQGRIATYAPMTGQEGAQVATGYALAAQDWLLPTYREHAAKYVHGMDLASLLKPLCGLREGYAIPDDVNVMPEYIPIATQVPQATGMAWGKATTGRDGYCRPLSLRRRGDLRRRLPRGPQLRRRLRRPHRLRL